MKKSTKIILFLLLGIIIYTAIDLFANSTLDSPHDFRSETLAFFLGPIVFIGNLLFWTTKKLFIDFHIYNFLSSPWPISYNAYYAYHQFNPTWTLVFTFIFRIAYILLLLLLFTKINLPGKLNQKKFKIPLYIMSIILILWLFYIINGDATATWLRHCQLGGFCV